MSDNTFYKHLQIKNQWRYLPSIKFLCLTLN